MNRNTIIAILLSSVIYIVWFTYIAPPPKKESLENKKQEIKIDNQNKIKAESANMGTSDKKEKVSNTKTISIKTQKSEILLTSNGTIKNLIYNGPINKIDFSLSEDSVFLSMLEDIPLKPISVDSNKAVFEGQVNKGLKLRKEIIFKDQDLNELNLTFINESAKKYIIPTFSIKMGPGLGTVESEKKENPKIITANYTFKEEGKKHPTIVKIKGDVKRDDWIWAGLNNRYFLFALINDGQLSNIAYENMDIGENKFPFIKIYTKEFIINPNEKKEIKLNFYAGPKDYQLLKKLDNGLDRSVDFGFFAPLAKLADSSLKFFYSKIGNYGLAIIVLSIVIQIIIFPLSMKSYKAMAVMKKLQPEMQALQLKYKNDPKRMNLELMELYKKYGANPLSGCWPMLLQIPIFFSLFTALRNSWNLHGANFAFWIKDLSAKDPYYVLPLIMGALMFWQQILNPQTTGDPTQNKIMKWMPVVFIFFFLSLPAGLVIYWIINSIFSVGQTLYLKSKEE